MRSEGNRGHRKGYQGEGRRERVESRHREGRRMESRSVEERRGLGRRNKELLNAQPQGAKTFRRKRAIQFLEQLETKQAH